MKANLKPGDQMLPIEGETPNGWIRLADYVGTHHVVLWTYPKDDTPG